MQVDSNALRAAAREIRAEVFEELVNARRLAAAAEYESPLDTAFDSYTTAAPLREISKAWLAELDLLIQAAHQLAESIDAAAADYDATDQRGATRVRVSATRTPR